MDDHHSDSHTEHKTTHSNSMPEIPKVDMKNVNADALKGGFGDVISILKLDKTVMAKVAGRDSEGISIALVYLAVGAIAAPLGGLILGFYGFHTGIVYALVTAVLAVVMAALNLYVTSMVAEKMFKGTGKFPQYFRVMGYASLVNVLGFLTIVPVLSTVASLFVFLVVNYFALTIVHKLNQTNAILTMIVSVVVFFVLAAIIGMLVATIGLGGAIGAGATVSLTS